LLASATEENATESVERLRDFLAADGRSAPRRAGLAWGLYLAGKPVEARAELDRAFEIDPECPLALAAQACDHLRHRRFERAEDGFRRALAGAPAVTEWRRLRARSLLALGRDEEARVEAERSVALAPRSPPCYLAVGDVHLRTGRLAAALRWYEAACRLAGPDSTIAREHAAVLAAMR
jgi:Flp pilus assembly protein TadD